MKKDHIISLLDEHGYRGLNAAQRAAAEDHTESCRDCARAYRAARIAEDLLAKRANAEIDVQPFFARNVMANIRAQNSVAEPPLIWRLWQATRFAMAAMVAIVAVLVVLTWRAGEAPRAANSEIASRAVYQPENILLDEQLPADDSYTDTQLLTTLFGPEDGYVNDK